MGLRPDSVLTIGMGRTYDLSRDEEIDLDRFRNELDDDGKCKPEIGEREPREYKAESEVDQQLLI